MHRWLINATEADMNIALPNPSKFPVPKRNTQVNYNGLAAINDAPRALLNDDHAISFKVIPGAGGIAIEYGQYDHLNDQHKVHLHIVPEDRDLAQELAHIITIQSLRR